MKKFSVREFIGYNNPCFGCGEKIIFEVRLGGSYDAAMPTTVKPDRIEADLKITYTHTLQLWIFHKTNKILTSDMRGLTDYLTERKLYLRSRCNKCYTNVDSQFLEFNLNKGFVKAVGISSERIMVTDDCNIYQMHSSFIDETSRVVVDRIDKAVPVSPMQFHLPLLPMYKLKDKEQFLNKIKTYITFS